MFSLRKPQNDKEEPMRLFWILGLCLTLLAALAGAAEKAEEGWKTYRSEEFGFELAYPPDMEYRAYGDGSSAELKAATTGRPLVQLEVWPPSECPRQPADAIAKEVGIDRAKAVTQADGPDGSSYCGDHVTVRESVSPQGVKIYALELTCGRETYPGSPDDTDEAEAEPPPVEAQPGITAEGKKGPTYFADISPSWKQRVLLADPVGVDPRMQPTQEQVNLAVVREILGTLRTFPIRKPSEICIDELQHRGFSFGIPTR
jgi:hypothetical protein